MVRIAISHNLPVIHIPSGISFKDLNRVVTGELMEREALQNNFREMVNRTLMEAFFNGGLPALTRALEEIMDRPVSLYNVFLEALDGNRHGPALPNLHSLHSTLRNNNREKEWIEITGDGELPDRILWPIRVNNETHGYLCVLTAAPPLREKEWIALRQAASVCLLELVKLNSLLESKATQVRNLLNRLLDGEKPERLREQLKTLGLDPGELSAVLLLEVALPGEAPVPEESLKRLEKTALHLLSSKNIPALVSLMEKDRLAILFQTSGKKKTSLLKEINALWEQLRSYYPLGSFKGGCGNITRNLEDVDHIFGEAEKALRGARLGLAEAILPVHYGELGLNRIFLEMPNPGALESLCAETIGKIQQHDQKHPGRLLPTLRTYLRHMNISRAAEELFIHRHTLKYRLRKIEQLTGRSLMDPEQALQLYMYLKLFDYLEAYNESRGRFP